MTTCSLQCLRAPALSMLRGWLLYPWQTIAETPVVSNARLRCYMKGPGRMDARDEVRDDIDRVLEVWRRAPG
jgi:hypothetical protein